ncbi:MAG: YcxB family protein [Candidatus Hydrogenedentota bacterium]
MSNEVDYLVTEEDTVAALRLHWKPTRVIQSFQIFIGVWVVILAFVGPTNTIKILALSCIGFYILTRKFLGPYIQRRTYRKYKLLQEPVSLSFDADGVKFVAQSYNTAITWKHLVRWKDNDRFILLYVSPRQYYVIPKRIGDDGFDVEGLIETLRSSF